MACGLTGEIRIACSVCVLPASPGTYRLLSSATPGGTRGSLHILLRRHPRSATFHKGRDWPRSETIAKEKTGRWGPGQAWRALPSPSGVDPRAWSSGPGLGSRLRLPRERRAAVVSACCVPGSTGPPAMGQWRSLSLRGVSRTRLHANLAHGKLLGRLSASVKS